MLVSPVTGSRGSTIRRASSSSCLRCSSFSFLILPQSEPTEPTATVGTHRAYSYSWNPQSLQPQSEPAEPTATVGTHRAYSHSWNPQGLQPQSEPTETTATVRTRRAYSHSQNPQGLQPQLEPTEPTATVGTHRAYSHSWNPAEPTATVGTQQSLQSQASQNPTEPTVKGHSRNPTEPTVTGHSWNPTKPSHRPHSEPTESTVTGNSQNPTEPTVTGQSEPHRAYSHRPVRTPQSLQSQATVRTPQSLQSQAKPPTFGTLQSPQSSQANFGLYMIISQSFQFVGRIVQLSCSLQAHLHVAHKIVNDINSFLCGGCPDPGCNCCLQVTHCPRVVFIHSVLQITPTAKNLGGGGRGGGLNRVSVSPTLCHNLLVMSRLIFSNHRLSHNRVLLEVRGGPILLKPLFISSDGPASAQCCPKLPMHHCCVTDNFTHRSQVCLQRQGGHLEHILGRT